MKICIIEDNHLYANLMKRYLSLILKDSEINLVEDAEKYLEDGKKYDVVFSDIQLHVDKKAMTGIDLIKERKLNGDKTKYIILSSANEEKNKNEIKELGVDFIQKKDFVRLDSTYDIESMIYNSFLTDPI